MTTTSATPQRLYLMKVGYIPTVNIPFVCYLVQMSDSTNVLIDSGLIANHPGPPGMPAPVRERDAIAQLALIGLQPDNIDLLICTHFDADHIGELAAFNRARLVIQRSHY